MSTDVDELEVKHVLPRLLRDDATPAQMIKAINGLAVETQLIREAVRGLGVTIGTFCRRMERAMGATTTEPAPPPKE